MQENVKLITVKKTVRQAFRTEPIWQYDVGHVLSLEGFENLPDTFQMHFSRSAAGDSITQVGQNWQVTLPDEFAQTAAPVYAWLYVAEEETGLTKYTVEIPVMRRARITNQQPTPVEQSAIDQAISALNAGVTRAETAAANAESSEDAAAASAESAYRSSEAAANSAESAEGDAQTATQKALEAQTAALSADNSATAAAESASAAAASAVSADGSATAAGNAATSAQTAANNASASAQTAADKASAAAQTKAEIDDEVTGFQAELDSLNSAISDKQDSPETPGTAGQVLGLDANLDPVWTDQTGGDESGLAPVIRNSASGSIASFADGADGRQIDSLVVNITPVQDLHGQEAPYPPGGGKNKLNAIEENIIFYNTSYNKYTFADGVVTITGNVLMGFVVPVQPSTQYTASFYKNNTSDSVSLRVREFSQKPTGMDSTGYIQQPVNNSSTNNNISGTFTTTAETTWVLVCVYRSGTPSETLTISNWQLEAGSARTAYAPYSNVCDISGWTGCNISHSGADTSDPTVLSISWQTEAGTVYGGTVDVISGVLTVNSVAVQITPDNISSRSDRAYACVTVGELGYVDLNITQICNVLPRAVSASDTANGKFVVINSGGYNRAHICFCFPGCYGSSAGETRNLNRDKVEELIASGITPTVVFGISEPITYQLTPNHLSTLLGINNIWASCGSIESVQYSADTKSYVDQSAENVPVKDVQINGTSILSDGVANVPVANTQVLGAVIVGNGLYISSNKLAVANAIGYIKPGTQTVRFLTPSIQHESSFFGLAKAAGADMKDISSTTVGVYPEAQKSAIHTMLNGSVSISGTTPSITALPGIRYVCGEVATLTITPPASGIVDVVFESGSTATVLTINGTVRWANGFDPSSLDANTTYEINICDGLGVAVGWT